MLLMPSIESPKDEESRESSFKKETGANLKETGANLDPAVVEGGNLRVRYITGKASACVTWSKRKGSLLKGGIEMLSGDASTELKTSIPERPSKPRKPYGFKQHVFQLILSMAMVTAVFGLLFALLGACIFLIGVALPFELI